MAIPDTVKRNYDTLQRASRAGHLALMECKHKATGELAYLLCAVNKDDAGDFTFVPFARMCDGNPYEDYAPPDPDDAEGFCEE